MSTKKPVIAILIYLDNGVDKYEVVEVFRTILHPFNIYVPEVFSRSKILGILKNGALHRIAIRNSEKIFLQEFYVDELHRYTASGILSQIKEGRIHWRNWREENSLSNMPEEEAVLESTDGPVPMFQVPDGSRVRQGAQHDLQRFMAERYGELSRETQLRPRITPVQRDSITTVSGGSGGTAPVWLTEQQLDSIQSELSGNSIEEQTNTGNT